MKKILPKITSDEEAESLLSEDLSEYLTPENFKENFTPVSFEFTPKDKTISIQISPELLEAVKAASAHRGIGYHSFILESIERAVRLDSKSFPI
jgi:predicted DNA binding CopG/RHH family protein